MEIIEYNAEFLEGTMNVLRKGFMDNESLCTGCEINKIESKQARLDMEVLCQEVVKDGVTLLARFIPNNKIIGVAFNKIQVLSHEKPFFEYFRDSVCKTDESRSLMQSMIDIDRKGDLFKKFDTNCILEIMFLCTLPQFWGQGIGQSLCSHSIQIATEMNRKTFKENLPDKFKNEKPKLVAAMFTSIYSQKIGDRLNFQRILEVPFKDLVVNGVKYSERVKPIHQTIVLVGKPI